MSIANELITRGWHQGDFEDGATGAVCLYGAAAAAAGEDPNLAVWGPEAERNVAAVKQALGTMLVASWNDERGRTFDEVLRVAKEADEILDAMETR